MARDLLNEPVPVHRFETTAEALTVWRQAARQQPTLLLLSNNPHLIPVPADLRQQAAILVNNANRAAIARASSDRSPSPVLIPGMAVDAALRSDWFGGLAWALPLRDPARELDLDRFADQLRDAGLASEEEIAALELEEQVFRGQLRGTPLTAAVLPLLQGLSEPVIVHIDLSYFQPLYKNDISTPLLDIVYATLVTLKKMHLPVLGVTLSYGHLDNGIALDVRFLGHVLAYLIEGPARLDQAVPLNWQRQRDALYLSNFFQKEKIRELYEAQEQEAPDQAWIKFNLYRSAAAHKEGDRALAYLAEAVALEPVFALEYLELSQRAYQAERPDEALRMLGLAAEAFADDPFIKLQMAELAAELGEDQQALELLSKLRDLQWSKIYYPQVSGFFDELTISIQAGKELSRSTGTEKENGGFPIKPAGPNAMRQRVLHTD